LVAVNNTLVVALAGRAHAASSWLCDSLPVSLDLVATQQYIFLHVKLVMDKIKK